MLHEIITGILMGYGIILLCGTVTLQELLVTTLAQTDAVAKLLIEKKVFTQKEFMEKIKAERATYQAMFQKAR